jgi:topoisomerase-4 subunit A
MSEELNNGQQNQKEQPIQDVIHLSGMYKNWFLDYASYVILERAVPAILDGFKPVQRRILHAMKEMDDGRYNKVANIIGSTMQFHPHGDAAIGDAITHLGQKDILIDTQGNWGDVRTGDRAAAARYIEARLSKFALDVVFNGQTTVWQLSYDGRKKEPVFLPVKFPLLLAQGVEGIAVGLSTKILPHNFNELIKASIDVLKGKNPKIFPDFPTGGLADVTDYNQGLRGGKVKVRARIEVIDKKEIAIRDIPFDTTTSSVIESIIKANDKGKIKIKKVVDNTARDVEIVVSLASGVSPDITIDALYAFTDCEVSISPNACVIHNDKPQFLSVTDILKVSTESTVTLLTQELEIRKAELLEKILFLSLERIFIENRIYRDIEECETWEAVISTIDKGLTPFKPEFYREITEEDIVRLTEIKIKRISKFDSIKADELKIKFSEELKEVEYNLANIVEYSTGFYNNLLEKYGKDKQRKTELTTFEDIRATAVVANNQKLYVNRKDGFVGYGLKKDEYIGECSDIDDIIVIRKDGVCMVSRISEKIFMGKDILYAGVWKKNDERMVYNVVYTDGHTGRSLVKRFSVLGVTRDKEYNLTKGGKGSRILYVTANPNGEAETVIVKLTSGCSARKKVFDFDFASIEIKGRGAGGNILTKYPVRRIELKSEGMSTLSGVDIWYDKSVGRLNRDQRGELVGKFNGEDKVLVIYQDGRYELTSYELTNRYEPEKIILIERFDPDVIVTAVHFDGAAKNYYVKRFQIESQSTGRTYSFISEAKGSKLIAVSVDTHPQVELTIEKGKRKEKETLTVDVESIIDVKGWKATGNKLSQYKVKKIKIIHNVQEERQTRSAVKGQPDTGKEKASDPELFNLPKKPKTPLKTKKESPKKPVSGEPKKDDGFDIGTTIEFDF